MSYEILIYNHLVTNIVVANSMFSCSDRLRGLTYSDLEGT